MVDKIRPLKMENSTSGGTEFNPFPTEADPTEDYISGKGFSFEETDTFLLQKIGRVLLGFEPDNTVAVTYTAGGDIDHVELFNSATQITANRIARIDITYSGVDPATEVLKVYGTDGSTVLRTLTTTYTYTGVDITSAGQVTT